MDLKKALGKDRAYQDNELNITPVMNVFLILIPFMLLTAVFVQIAVQEFSLPSTDTPASDPSQQKKAVLTILAINENGFELKTQGAKYPLILNKDEEFDFQTLVERLQEVKQLHQETEDIVIAPQASIKYDTIIKVMDRCRENGFSNISISG
jgi:biopolymer transport protein ExbD